MKMKANRFDSSFFAAWERILSITTEIWYPILLTQTYLLNTLLLNDSYVLFWIRQNILYSSNSTYL